MTERPSAALTVAALCAGGLALAAVAVVDTDLQRERVAARAARAEERALASLGVESAAPAPGLVRAPAPRRVVRVRRRARAS